jgi:prepilin-type N-terminal cleavage/methylation domain-containing protein
MNQQRGIGLIECLVALTIVGVLAAMGVPAWKSTVERHRLHAVAETFRTDFQLARMQTQATRRSVFALIENTVAGGCYVMYQGPQNACQCTAEGKPVCAPEATVLASQSLPKGAGVTLASNVKMLTMGASLGTVTPAATIKFQGSAGAHLNHVIAMTGRVRSCGTVGLGTPACKG